MYLGMTKKLAPLAAETPTENLTAAVAAVVALLPESDLDVARRVARELIEDSEGLLA